MRTLKPHRSALEIAIVTADASVRQVFGRVFDSSGEFICAGEFGAGKKALENICYSRVDLVVIDLALPDFCGIRCAREMLARAPHLKTVVVTLLRNSTFIECAFLAGITEFLVKPLNFSQCLATLRFASCGLRGITSDLPVRRALWKHTPLTTQEQMVLNCLGDGLLYKEIQDRLSMSTTRLRRLQRRIFHKLQAHNRTEAINKWRQV